jgi:1-deoxy-D-xylulose-5-phosphate synthase
VTVEDHVLAGGFGSAVAEPQPTAARRVPLQRLGIADRHVPHGDPADAARGARLRAAGIRAIALARLAT